MSKEQSPNSSNKEIEIEIFKVGDTVTYYHQGKQRMGNVLRADTDVHIYLVEFGSNTSVWLSYVQINNPSSNISNEGETVEQAADKYVKETGFTDELDQDYIRDSFTEGYAASNKRIVELIEERVKNTRNSKTLIEDKTGMATALFSVCIKELEYVLGLIKDYKK